MPGPFLILGFWPIGLQVRSGRYNLSTSRHSLSQGVQLPAVRVNLPMVVIQGDPGRGRQPRQPQKPPAHGTDRLRRPLLASFGPIAPKHRPDWQHCRLRHWASVVVARADTSGSRCRILSTAQTYKSVTSPLL